jgi:hypothetical protein
MQLAIASKDLLGNVSVVSRHILGLCLGQDGIYFSYFAPYTLDRHARLVARTQTKECARLLVLGQSVQGRDMDLLILGKLARALDFLSPPMLWNTSSEKRMTALIAF